MFRRINSAGRTDDPRAFEWETSMWLRLWSFGTQHNKESEFHIKYIGFIMSLSSITIKLFKGKTDQQQMQYQYNFLIWILNWLKYNSHVKSKCEQV